MPLNANKNPDDILQASIYLYLVTLILGAIMFYGISCLYEGYSLKFKGTETVATLDRIVYDRRKMKDWVSEFAQFRYETNRGEVRMLTIPKRNTALNEGDSTQVLYLYNSDGSVSANIDDFNSLFANSFALTGIPFTIIFFLWFLHQKDLLKRGLSMRKNKSKNDLLDN